MLSKRLTKVLDYIEPSDRVADIGADHGYLALAMIEKGVLCVQVVENKVGPLKRAQTTLKDYNFVQFSLSNGISDLNKNVNVITICGMGGLNVVEILSNDLGKAQKLDKIILQANSKVSNLRKFLNDNYFEILNEDVIFDKSCYYEIIVCKYNKNIRVLSDIELLFGPILLKNKTNDFILKYKNQLKEYEQILSNNISNDINMENLQKQVNLIKEHILGN